ncbi:MAG: DUF4214 domain-containing protein [Deltaproteobacteria bacterium]|nr:DUF4214 domain-containing protein [Deltaproteobacteria bacterium]
MKKLMPSFFIFTMALALFLAPASGRCDIATPTGWDGATMAINTMKTILGVGNSEKLLAAVEAFPRDIPVVIEAYVNYHGGAQKHVSAFRIDKVWPGYRTQPVQKFGVKSFNGVVQIHGKGTGPGMRNFPGLKLTLEPSVQDVDMCGAVHLGVVAEFRARGEDFRFPLPSEFIKWDQNAFNFLKVEDENTAQSGRLTSGHAKRDYTFYPAQPGEHRIGVTVDGVRATAAINIRPAKLSHLELLPDWSNLSKGSMVMRALVHFDNECMPPEDVTNQVQWDNQMALEPQPLKLEVVAPQYPSGRVEICKAVPLQAFLTRTPGRTLVFAHYQNLSASLPIDDSRARTPVDVTHQADVTWSTGSPVFQANVPGRFSVTATDGSSGLSASLSLEVVPPADVPLYPLDAIQVPGSLVEGKSATLTATAFNCDGAVPTTGLEWLSLTPELLSCSSAGACQAQKNGTAKIALLQNGKLVTQRSITIKPDQQSISKRPAPQPSNDENKFEKSGSHERQQVWRSDSDEAFVTSLYKNILDRNPDDGGLKHWIKLLKSGKSRESTLRYFFQSPEYSSRNKDHKGYAIDVFQALYGRDPSDGELALLLEQLNNGIPRQQLLASALSGSLAQSNDIPKSLTRNELVNSTWQFGRGDGSKIAGNLKLLANGRLTGHYHPNESRWSFNGQTLTFYHSSGKPSTTFSSIKKEKNRWIISGPYLLSGNITHVLKQNK